MKSHEFLTPAEVETLRQKGVLGEADQQQMLKSHAAVLEAMQGLIEAARAHRTAMNPQEVLDTGWALDERIEALERLLGEK